MQVIKYSERKDWERILKRPVFDNGSLELTVSTILNEVKLTGDAALKKYSLEFDKVSITDFLVRPEEFMEAASLVSDELKTAMVTAKNNITTFHTAQIEGTTIIETTPGVSCWRKAVAIEKVGLYIPGGTAPLFSTLLMLGIPAQLAGCKTILLCTPPDKNGKVNPAILYAAQLVGISAVYKVGGVQAIGAMTYGTETIGNVYKIFGPGNQYVTCAKQLVSQQGVAIDMPAGPSELAILADANCNPQFVAADLLSQAEHGADSQVILVTDNEACIAPIQAALALQLDALPRKTIAEQAIKNSKIILVNNKQEAIELLNQYAPEHLILSCAEEDELAAQIINAGSVFIGNYSPESAGDYASGTNHTLPTNGYAKSYSGVSWDSFVKKITFQKLTKQGMVNIGKAIELMAEAEGLHAHKNAVSIRLNEIEKSIQK